jgi:hypothetical protein
MSQPGHDTLQMNVDAEAIPHRSVPGIFELLHVLLREIETQLLLARIRIARQ